MKLAKQIIIRGYLLLESLDLLYFFLQMAYKLFSESRKLDKQGVVMRAEGGWKSF